MRAGLIFCWVFFQWSGVGWALPRPARYHALPEIRIGGEGGWDCLSVDESTHRLFMSHATKVVVVDLKQGSVVGEIGDTPGVHAIAFASEKGLGFTTNGKEDAVGVFDLKTLKMIRKVPVGANPDLILYVPASREIYALNGKGKSVSVFGVDATQVEKTIPLPGKPEFAVYDAKLDRVFVNIEDKNAIAVIDPKKRASENTFALAGCESPSGLALDSAITIYSRPARIQRR